jgi:hypothetical protein
MRHPQRKEKQKNQECHHSRVYFINPARYKHNSA